MKRLTFPFLLLCGLLGLTTTLTSCGAAEEEYHTLNARFAEGQGYMFADQEDHAIIITATDDWTLTSDNPNLTLRTDWTQGTEIQRSVRGGYLLVDSVFIHVSPNFTGKKIYTQFTCTSPGAEATIGQRMYQLPILHIVHPDPINNSFDDITDNGSGVKTYYFEYSVKDDGTAPFDPTPYIAFTPYSTDATVTTDASWVALSQSEGFEKGKPARINLTVEKNTSRSPRQAEIRVTSNGITTPILLKQEGHNPDTEA